MGDVLKSKVATFRIKELQQCLDLLGLRKAGRKAELLQRLVAFVEQGSVAEVEKKVGIVNKVHAVMHGIPTNDAPSGAAARSSAAAAAAQTLHVPAVDPRAAVAFRSAQVLGRANTTIRCICRQNQDSGRQMIQCEDEWQYCCSMVVLSSCTILSKVQGKCPGHPDISNESDDPECGVWQHCSCVGLAQADLPGQWFCEQCRAALADPFWRRTHLFDQPVRLQRQQPAKYTPAGAAEYVWAGETFVQARSADLDPVRRQQERVMVASILLTDSVPFRFNWPRSSDLRINNMQYRPYTRNNSTKLGDNARDEPATVGQMISSSGRNRVALACIEEREPFCEYLAGASEAEILLLAACPAGLMVYRATQRTLEEVKALMAAPETPQAALERVSRQLGGAKAGADGDDEDDFEMGNTVTSLRDPFTNMRIKVPVRFAGVKGIAAFDLDTFLEMAQRTRKWQCPHSMRNMSVRQLHLDGWMMQVLQALQDKADVAEVEVDPQGRWRPLGSLGRWFTILEDHSSICASLAQAGQIKPEPGTEAAGAFGDRDSDEESEDEMEELRRAAAAMKAASSKPKEADVIILDSSDDDTPPPLPPVAAPSATDAGAPPFYLHGNKPSARAAAPAASEPGAREWLTQARQHKAVGSDGRPWHGSSGNPEQLAQPQQQPSANALGHSGAGLLQGAPRAGLRPGISAYTETQPQRPPVTLRLEPAAPDGGGRQGSAGTAPGPHQQSSGSVQRADFDIAARDSSAAPAQRQEPPAGTSGLRQLPPSLGGPGPAAPGTTMPGRVTLPSQQPPPASGGLTVRLRLPGRGSQPPPQSMPGPASAGVRLPTSPGSPQASHSSLLGKRKAAEKPAETASPFSSPPHMPIVPNGVSRSQGPVPVMPAGPVASSGLNLPGSATGPGGLNPPGAGSSTAPFSSLLIPGMPRSPAMPNGGTQPYSMYTGLYGSQAQQQQQQAPAMLGVRHPATLPGQAPAQSAGWGSSGLQMPFASSAAGASSVQMSFASMAAAPVQVPLTQVPAASLQLPGAALQPPAASVQLPTGRGSPLQMPTGSSAPTPGAQQGVTYPYNSHHPQQQQPVMPMGHLSPAKSPGLKLPGQQPQANGSSAWGSGVSISARMSDAERASAVRELTSKARPHLTNSHGVRLPGATADQAIDLSDSE